MLIFIIFFKKYLFKKNKFFEKKIKDVDINFILKTLVNFEEIVEEPLIFMPSKKVTLEKIKKFIIKEIKNIYK